MDHAIYHPLEYFVDHHVPAWIAHAYIGIALASGRGVDLFFALSAYLITELLLREKDERGSLDVRSFYIRRILRIWPLYYLFLFAVGSASLLDASHPLSLRHFLAFSLLAGNWGLVIFGATQSVAGPLWTVSIEEQFYLLWPPVVARLTRRRIAFLALCMIAVANAVRIAMLLSHCTSWQVYFNTFARLDSIGGGILLAVLLRGRVPALRFGVRAGLIASAVACIGLTGYFKQYQTHPTWAEMVGSYPAAAACCTLIVFCFLGLRMEFRWLQYLGKISYGLYVYHYATIRIVDKMLGERSGFVHALLRPALGLGLTILVAAASYALLEKPFLKLKRRFTYVDSRPV